MGMKEEVSKVQSCIDHIKTSVDVDPWAKDMAADALRKQQPRRVWWNGRFGFKGTRFLCPSCGGSVRYLDNCCYRCGQRIIFPRHGLVLHGSQRDVIAWLNGWDEE